MQRSAKQKLQQTNGFPAEMKHLERRSGFPKKHGERVQMCKACRQIQKLGAAHGATTDSTFMMKNKRNLIVFALHLLHIVSVGSD